MISTVSQVASPPSASLVLGKKRCRAQVQDPGTVFSPWISVC